MNEDRKKATDQPVGEEVAQRRSTRDRNRKPVSLYV